ncbi:M23 family metallopeptidase [Paenibacillus sp. YPG26]|uniref:M23 family metallopeptidase n=1 Tax=Paenibacillus sp. YPG26 TaxID=2878915 RepID=UPI00203B2C09|nr:M23 family metallopeptidase [Paenibacillus sp. YPG26]USB34028.1 M23 family metallopeptidase [Paenibacillus sp. YPG26]
MRNAASSRKMTLLILQDANHAVKQIQVSKPLVIVIPLAALLSISGLIVSLQTHSGRTVASLEQELHSHNMQLQAVVTDKDEAIKRLQAQIITLSAESQSVKNKVQKVSELENELRHMIRKFGTGKAVSASTMQSEESPHIGGEFFAVHDVNTASRLAYDTQDDFAQISELINAMVSRVPGLVAQAEHLHQSLSGTPSFWPTLSRNLSSSFGYRSDPFTNKSAFHAGVDISGEIGDPIYSAGAGTVLQADHSPARGNYIIIKHPNGLQTWYMHLNRISVNVDDKVTKGAVIGTLGSTGRSTGPHLHFQVLKQNQPIDPLPYLTQE